ncbi:MAG: hypothetical protein QM426_10545 [Euryarchaeota archaeon]|nr:hypothetical protein [Euryarchaeota archaeon]
MNTIEKFMSTVQRFIIIKLKTKSKILSIVSLGGFIMINRIRRLISGWSELEPHEVPKWVQKAAEDFEILYHYKHGHKPYDVITHFTGRTFKYKVYFETFEQGKINLIVYRKLR